MIEIAVATTSCVGENSDPIANYCIDTVDTEGEPTPNCVNTGTEETPTWTCAKCAANCDCRVGEYCRKTPGPLAGTCANVAEISEKIGRPCVSFGYPTSASSKIPTKGVDDELVCGEAVFDATTGAFEDYEWLGACVEGRCRECSGGPLTWALFAVEQQTIGSGQFAGSLICSGRTCESGRVAEEGQWWGFDYVESGVDAGILAFVVFIFVLSCFRCLMSACGKKKPMLLKVMDDVGDRLESMHQNVGRTKRRSTTTVPGSNDYENSLTIDALIAPREHPDDEYSGKSN